MTRIGELARVLALAVFGVTLWDSYGCSFVVDAASLGGGGCASGKKACVEPGTGKDLCVSQSDPTYGCGAEKCQPCTTLLRGTDKTTCINNICTRLTCLTNFLDCDGNAQNGCEVDARIGTLDPVNRTIKNCGLCTDPLNPDPSTFCRLNAGATGNPICDNGHCGVDCSGVLPLNNCNNVSADGCECGGTCMNRVCGTAF